MLCRSVLLTTFVQTGHGSTDPMTSIEVTWWLGDIHTPALIVLRMYVFD